MTASGGDPKFWHGSPPAAIQGIPENICSSRAFLGLTHGRYDLSTRSVKFLESPESVEQGDRARI